MNDNLIYTKIGDGDMNTFEMLVFDYNLPLNAYVYRLVNDKDVSEDIVQDIFASIWMNRYKLNFNKSISNYLYTSARNASYNFLLKSKRYREIEEYTLPANDYTDALVIEEEVNRMLSRAITQLPTRTAEVIQLSLNGFSHKEIADKMNVTVSNVKNLKSMGIKRLKDLMGPFFVFIVMKLGS